MPELPSPPTNRPAVQDWVREHLGHVTLEEGALENAAVPVSSLRGGQAAADAALAALDLTGYAARRSTVLPVARRGATRLSPYLRHGLLTLPEVWRASAGAAGKDRFSFRNELLWQEYARHLYARLGRATGRDLRFTPAHTAAWDGEPWPQEMACMRAGLTELTDDGWLVNQVRLWMSGQWAVRAGRPWQEGAEEVYRHLLDGSPAANRLGWQWAAGTATGKPYGFSRWQVEKRAPQLCADCPLSAACPVQDWPEAQVVRRPEPEPRLSGGPTDAGPVEPEVRGTPEAVWLTAESLSAADPALAAHPELPAVFVFDEPLLARLRLSAKRLVFLAETLAQLRAEVRLGDPRTELAGRPLAVTWTFAPGFRVRSAALDVAALHPWPWLRRPDARSLRSFSAWAR